MELDENNMNKETTLSELERRIEVLRRTEIAGFGQASRRFMNFLRRSEILGPLFVEIIEGYPSADSMYKSYMTDSPAHDLSDLPPEQLAAVGIIGLSELR